MSTPKTWSHVINTENELQEYLRYLIANCSIPWNVTIKVVVPSSVIIEAVDNYTLSLYPNDVPETVHVYYLGIEVELKNSDKHFEEVSE